MGAFIKKEDIKLREVYLADLASVIRLYKNNSSSLATTEDVKEKLTVDFGLPIGVAERHGKVIACSNVTIDDMGKPTFQIHSNGITEDEGIAENLTRYASMRFTDIWGNSTNPNILIKPVNHAIDRLVNWLNHCN